MTLLDFELMAHKARMSAPVTSRPLYRRGEYPPITPPALPTVEQAATREAQRREAEKFWERPRCLECLSIVIVNTSPHVWHCSNLACGRHGWCMQSSTGHDVRTVDNEPRAT